MLYIIFTQPTMYELGKYSIKLPFVFVNFIPFIY